MSQPRAPARTRDLPHPSATATAAPRADGSCATSPIEAGPLTRTRSRRSTARRQDGMAAGSRGRSRRDRAAVCRGRPPRECLERGPRTGDPAGTPAPGPLVRRVRPVRGGQPAGRPALGVAQSALLSRCRAARAFRIPPRVTCACSRPGHRSAHHGPARGRRTVLGRGQRRPPWSRAGRARRRSRAGGPLRRRSVRCPALPGRPDLDARRQDCLAGQELCRWNPRCQRGTLYACGRSPAPLTHRERADTARS